MDTHYFDDVTKALTAFPSRRDLLRGLVGAAFGLGVLRFAGTTEAKKNHKSGHKRKRKDRTQQPVVDQPVVDQPGNEPLPFNQYGCLGIDQPCGGDSSLCCSGICRGIRPREGEPDLSRCVAHGTGTCDQHGPGYCTVGFTEQTACNKRPECLCMTTTAGSNFCTDTTFSSGGRCADCNTDTDCELIGFPKGSACVPQIDRCDSLGSCPSNKFCQPPCPIAPRT